jgi:hypothetical protein
MIMFQGFVIISSLTQEEALQPTVKTSLIGPMGHKHRPVGCIKHQIHVTPISQVTSAMVEMEVRVGVVIKLCVNLFSKHAISNGGSLRDSKPSAIHS